MSKYKTSYGIALCRYNTISKEANRCVEILSIKKRFTYYYFSFINGFYKGRTLRNDDVSYVKYLFDNMSYQEKLIILSMNYGTMWWYIWLNNPEKGINMFEKTEICKISYNASSDGKYEQPTNLIQAVNGYTTYFKRKNKFEKKFLQDNGRRLHDIINNSKSSESIWEIPKGAADYGETNLDTSIREFTEESQIDPIYYNILYHVEPVVIIYKDSGVMYRHIYYIAELNELGYATHKIMKPKIDFKSFKQISEVSDMRWISTSYINTLNLPSKNKKNMLKLYNKYRTNIKF
jgi:ADP-ribose pyrophosphatase YjhB (NUDIX family)